MVSKARALVKYTEVGRDLFLTPVKRPFVIFNALMNGYLLTSEDMLLDTLTHELGHTLGLDHSQINKDFADAPTDDNAQYIPMMYPIGVKDSMAALTPDDISWVSKLYPSPAFNTSYGIIKGTLVRRNGSGPVLGANVVLTKLDEVDQTFSRLFRYSSVSGWLGPNEGAFEVAVTPGRYRITLEAIDDSFVGPSSVGLYASDASGKSFDKPINSKEFATLYLVNSGAVTNVGALVAD
jgi:hypothetical protein